VLAAGLRIDEQRAPRRGGKIGVERPGDPFLDDIDRARHRIGRHRHRAGQRLEIDQAEGVGAAGEHQDVGRRQMRGKIRAEAITGEDRARMAPLQPGPLRAVTDHDPGAGPIHVEEGIDVLFHRHAADVGRYGPRQIQKVLRSRPEQLGVDAAAPLREVREAARRQIAAQRSGADHAARGRGMEPAQGAIGHAQGHGKPGAQILGKLRVVRARETNARAHAKAPGGEPQRSLGGDVQGLGRKLQNGLLDVTVGPQREPDFRISRAGNAAKIARREHAHRMTEAAEPRCRLGQGADDAVGLRKPSIRDDHDPHALRHWHCAMTKR